MKKLINYAQLTFIFAAGFLTAILVVTEAPKLFGPNLPAILGGAQNSNSALNPVDQVDAARRTGPVGRTMPVENVDWKNNQRTLVLYLSTTCHYCNESSPFYKRLVEKFGDSTNLKLVAVLPDDTSVAKQHLNRLGVNIGDVYSSELDSIGVVGTPTLLLVNESGTISDMWRGKLTSAREIEVLNKLAS